MDVVCPIDGNTALHYATVGEHEEIIALLLTSGAKTTIQNNAYHIPRALLVAESAEAWLCYDREVRPSELPLSYT